MQVSLRRKFRGLACFLYAERDHGRKCGEPLDFSDTLMYPSFNRTVSLAKEKNETDCRMRMICRILKKSTQKIIKDNLYMHTVNKIKSLTKQYCRMTCK